MLVRLSSALRLALYTIVFFVALHIASSVLDVLYPVQVERVPFNPALQLATPETSDRTWGDVFADSLSWVQQKQAALDSDDDDGTAGDSTRLYELAKSTAGYFDARTKLDRLRLSSSKIVGDEAADAGELKHIVISGAFSESGLEIASEILAHLDAAVKKSASPLERRGTVLENTHVTLVDTHDASDRLASRLASKLSPKMVATDPRARLVKSTERIFEHLVTQGSVSVARGHLGDPKFVASLLERAPITGLIYNEAEIDPLARVTNESARPGASLAAFLYHIQADLAADAALPFVVAASAAPHTHELVRTLARTRALHAVLLELPYREGILEVSPEVARIVRDALGHTAIMYGGAPGHTAGEASVKDSDAPEPESSDLEAPEPDTSDPKDPSPADAADAAGAPAEDAPPAKDAQPPADAPHVQKRRSRALRHASRSSPTPLDVPLSRASFADGTPAPLLSTSDIATAVHSALRLLVLARGKPHLASMSLVAAATLVGPEPAPLAAGDEDDLRLLPLVDVAHAALAATQSQAPLQRPTLAQRDALRAFLDAETTRAAARTHAARVLGVTPSTGIPHALHEYIAELLDAQIEYSARRQRAACASAPPVSMLEEGLLDLNGCTVQLLTVVEGVFYGLACAGGESTDTEAAATAAGGRAGLSAPEPLGLFNAVPFREGLRGVQLLAERGVENKVDIQILCPELSEGTFTGQTAVVAWGEPLNGTEVGFPQFVSGTDSAEQHVISTWFTLDFDEDRSDSRAFSILLPPVRGADDADRQRLSYVDVNLASAGKTSGKRPAHSGFLAFEPILPEDRPTLWKVNPICCPTGAGARAGSEPAPAWNFFAEDPLLTSQVVYPGDDGRTSVRESTLSIKRCEDLRNQVTYLSKMKTRLFARATRQPAEACNPQRSSHANEWTSATLPICSVDCAAPVPCIATSKCRCAADRCGAPQNGADRAEAVASESPEWSDIILPRARDSFNKVEAFIHAGASNKTSEETLKHLPKIFVLPLSPSLKEAMDYERCWNDSNAPVPKGIADYVFIEALQKSALKVDAIEDADMVVVPFYHHCIRIGGENVYKVFALAIHELTQQLKEYTPLPGKQRLTAEDVIIPLMDDYGSCLGWWPLFEELLGRHAPAPLDRSIAWQSFGDYNTRCLKVGRDIVAPAYSSYTEDLFGTFNTPKDVTPVLKRPYLAYFAGSLEGIGAVTRTKLGCNRTPDVFASIALDENKDGDADNALLSRPGQVNDKEKTSNKHESSPGRESDSDSDMRMDIVLKPRPNAQNKDSTNNRKKLKPKPKPKDPDEQKMKELDETLDDASDESLEELKAKAGLAAEAKAEAVVNPGAKVQRRNKRSNIRKSGKRTLKRVFGKRQNDLASLLATNSKILYQQFAPGKRYIGTLASTKFCLIPRSLEPVPTFLFEAIFAGCIPVLMAENTFYPFQDILDYSLFSVSISEIDVPKVEEILEAIDEKRLVSLQTHLVKARHAFMHVLPEPELELKRQGPFFFTLVSLLMRNSLTYVPEGTCLNGLSTALD